MHLHLHLSSIQNPQPISQISCTSPMRTFNESHNSLTGHIVHHALHAKHHTLFSQATQDEIPICRLANHPAGHDHRCVPYSSLCLASQRYLALELLDERNGRRHERGGSVPHGPLRERVRRTPSVRFEHVLCQRRDAQFAHVGRVDRPNVVVKIMLYSRQ